MSNNIELYENRLILLGEEVDIGNYVSASMDKYTPEQISDRGRKIIAAEVEQKLPKGYNREEDEGRLCSRLWLYAGGASESIVKDPFTHYLKIIYFAEEIDYKNLPSPDSEEFMDFYTNLSAKRENNNEFINDLVNRLNSLILPSFKDILTVQVHGKENLLRDMFFPELDGIEIMASDAVEIYDKRKK